MQKRAKKNINFPKKVLILGSGGLRIGQAGEFDYSGSQAIKALKAEGIKTVLINPNIATIQTDATMADELYLEPLNVESVTKIIAKEKPDAILLGFGGQTALNLGLALDELGVLKKHHVRVLGTSVATIKITEDRDLFKQALDSIGVHTAKSFAVKSVEDALIAAKKINYPIMMRSGYSLGGLGSGKIADAKELKERATEALHNAPQILIEEYLGGWKEIEYEIVRDSADNVVTVCNMENFDPMGIHTGESIVVAPSQTLTNEEYHMLREVAIKVARHLKIIGECNIQYALNPKTGDYRVIEVNARLSRSSALASKATGYPLAFVAAKLALGYRMDQITNSVTKKTCAFFEPALDYLVVKIPRWDMTKFSSADRRIGTEMKSVGEVMGIGRSFPEALQKAVRMLNIGASGLSDYPIEIPDIKKEITVATDRRLFAIYEYLRNNHSVKEVHEQTNIDPWFLSHIKTIANYEKKIQGGLNKEIIREAKQLGFSDKTIGKITQKKESAVRSLRQKYNILPFVKQIDTLAGEFPAETNYLYLTYHGNANDTSTKKKSPVIILGSGPYCIGSSVEFDWCAVNTARTLRTLNIPTVIINSNPETVSTDYDESDYLFFEELTLERIQDIADIVGPRGIIVSVGGQIPNNLALPLKKSGYPILGTDPDDIDRAENRHVFSKLLEKLNIDQPAWQEVTTLERAKAFADSVGYPVLVRPSYVLSGAAMRVVHSKDELTNYIHVATKLSPDHPVVLSQFITEAKELEIDGVASNGTIIIEAMSEHIEHAGVHSGDATIVLPPQRLYLETIRRTKQIARKIVESLRITGPFNIQFLAKNNAIQVIECNLRASRSFPFVSKVTNHNFISIATELIIGNAPKKEVYKTLELPIVGVKIPQFSYQRLKGTDPVAAVEMASTGEVAVIGRNIREAFWLAWRATEQSVNGKRILISIGSNEKKEKFIPLVHTLETKGWEIFATEGTHAEFAEHGIGSTCIFKSSELSEPNVATLITSKNIDLIINIPNSHKRSTITDGFTLRRLAIDHRIPLVTNSQDAELILTCLTELDESRIPMLSWKELMHYTYENDLETS
ncbi:MAG: carbamoyl-phosphate synthase (glutamine-hydrolyzing) large subunit [Candidatus Magasanikbacteria bacterium]|nr:carbamoyl-phosphate synthase (glutamine-hydrolyzing) large subunit [Candidatus Magasanikbacteria bacterium]